MGSSFLPIASLLAAAGVFLGAFGAHVLPDLLAARELSDSDLSNLSEIFETAVRYQMYHALALFGVGLSRLSQKSRLSVVAGVSFLTGIFIFSGGLYVLVFSGVKILGAVVPLGGAAFIVGWIALAFASLRKDVSTQSR